MKFEDESMFFDSTLSDKPSSKADESHSERSKIENEEIHDRIVSNPNGDINLDDRLQCSIEKENGWNPFKEDSSSINSGDNDDVEAVNLPEFDRPKPMVFLDESSCDIVKDICIDERINTCSSSDNEDIAKVDELEISSVKDFIDQTVIECGENDLNSIPNVKIEQCDDNDNDAVEMTSEIENFSNNPTISACKETKNVPSSTNRGPEDDDVTNGSSSNTKTEKIGSELAKLSDFEDGRSIQTQLGFGESSFSSAASLASLVNYTVPVTNSGNLSIRSDSSTKSTQSFAFPILPAEWNHNSPVLMAEGVT